MNLREFPLIYSLLVACLAAPSSASSEDRISVAFWTFEDEFLTGTGSTIGPIVPEFGNGTVSGFHLDDQTVWSSPVGNGSGGSLSSTRWVINDFYQFAVSTIGFSQIELGWDMTRSTAGPEEWELRYSTDGNGFTSLGSSFMVDDIGWSSTSSRAGSVFFRDLTELSEIEQQGSLSFRLVALSEPSSTAGTARVDNVRVTAVPVPEPAAYAVIFGALALVAAGGFRCRRRLR